MCSSSQCTEKRNITLLCQHITSVECKDYYKMKIMILKREKIECRERCTKKLECGHSCMNLCSEPCTENCIAMVTESCPKGVHKLKVKCGDSPPLCNQKCPNKLPCGHSCKMKCSEECKELCDMIIEKRNCACGHTHDSKCGDQSCSCKQKCQTILECGHKCSGKCGNCFSSRIHAPCPFEVHAKRYCGHYATVPCFGLEDKCTKVCQVASCLHTSNPCDHKCYESCDTECTEQCQYECKHNKCTRLCSEKCDVQPCNKPCNQMLDCGHQCLGLCGEKCLSQCIICTRKKFISAARGLDKKSTSKAESFQYIELSCGHLFTTTYLDKYYQFQQGKDRLVSPLLCPACQKIAACNRYSIVMKERQKEIKDVKLRVPKTDCEEVHFESKFAKFQMIVERLGVQLVDTRSNKAHLLEQVGSTRHRAALQASGHIIVTEFNKSSGEALLFLKMFIEIGKLCVIPINESSHLRELARQLFERVTSISKQEKTWKLSLQLINDIERELYRISLLYMIGEVEEVLQTSPKNARSMREFDDVLKLIDHTKSSNSCLTKEVYIKHVSILERIFDQHNLFDDDELIEPVDVEHISCPVITKGQWYCCAREGHYYFVPAKYRKGKEETSCGLCKKPSRGVAITQKC